MITDSLGLPRKSGDELVPFENTWVNLLKKNYDVHHVSIGGATIYQLYEQIKYNELFQPDLVIVQSGIVDCAPRAFKMAEKQLLASIPIIKNIFNKVAERYGKKIRNARNVTYTKPELFKLYINKIQNDFKNKPVLFVGIVPASAEYEKAVQGITKNIELFNSILKKEAGDNFIDTSVFINDHVLSDFHHLSSSGNQLLFDKISQKIPSKTV